MDKLREFIWERCQGDDKATDEIISAIEGLVPSEEEIETIVRQNEFQSGIQDEASTIIYPKRLAHACREEMLKRLGGDVV